MKKQSKTNLKLNRKKGIALAFGTLFLQGFEGVYIALIGIAFILTTISNPSFSSAILLSKEIFGIAFIVVLFGPKIIINVIKKIKTKETLLYISAGAFGTAMGNFMYIMAIALAGSSYGVILSSLYPICTLLLLRFINKQKQVPIVWFGVIMTIVAGVLFIFLPQLINNNEKMNFKKIIGILCGLFAAFFWAIEVFLISFATKLKGAKYTDREKLAARSISSLIFTILIIMPFSYIWGNAFENVSKIITNWKSLLVILGMSLNVVILRMVFSKAVKYVGIGTTSIIDSNNFLINPIASLILYKVPIIVDPAGSPLFEPLTWWSWLLVIPIFIGVLIVVIHNADDVESEKISVHISDI